MGQSNGVLFKEVSFNRGFNAQCELPERIEENCPISFCCFHDRSNAHTNPGEQ